MNTDRANALEALQNLFADRKDVRVYNAAGRRVCVKVTVQRRIVEIVWDVTSCGSKCDPYTVDGIDNLYCASLGDVLDFVEDKVNRTVEFFEAMGPTDRRWNGYADPEEIVALKSALDQ